MTEKAIIFSIALPSNMAGLVPFRFSVNSIDCQQDYFKKFSSSPFLIVSRIKVFMWRYIITYKTLLCTDSSTNSYVDEEETCLPEDTLRTRGQLFSDYLGGIGVRENMGFGQKTGTRGQGQDISRTCPGLVQLSNITSITECSYIRGSELLNHCI